MPFDGPSHVLITIEPQHGKRQDKKGVSQRADISSFAKYRKPKKKLAKRNVSLKSLQWHKTEEVTITNKKLNYFLIVPHLSGFSEVLLLM